MGARPSTIFGLLILEAVLVAAAGAIFGLIFLYFGLSIAQPLIDRNFGLWLDIAPPGGQEALILLAVVAAGAIVSILPALRAYKLSLADGMMVKT